MFLCKSSLSVSLRFGRTRHLEPSNLLVVTASTPCPYESTTPAYQPAAYSVSFFFWPTLRIRPLSLQICSFVYGVLQTACDLVVPRFGPMIRAKLLLLCHCPLHDGSSRLRWRVSSSIGASSLWISPMSISLFYHREKAHNQSSPAAVTST
jgi:hypothetical protein